MRAICLSSEIVDHCCSSESALALLCPEIACIASVTRIGWDSGPKCDSSSFGRLTSMTSSRKGELSLKKVGGDQLPRVSRFSTALYILSRSPFTSSFFPLSHSSIRFHDSTTVHYTSRLPCRSFFCTPMERSTLQRQFRLQCEYKTWTFFGHSVMRRPI